MHAGLECGIIQESYPDMDMISIGPDLQHPHSPDERVSIPSVARTWDFIVTTLARIWFVYTLYNNIIGSFRWIFFIGGFFVATMSTVKFSCVVHAEWSPFSVWKVGIVCILRICILFRRWCFFVFLRENSFLQVWQFRNILIIRCTCDLERYTRTYVYEGKNRQKLGCN